MNKNTNFSEKAQYVTPSCKFAELEPNGLVCTSYGDAGKAGAKGRYCDETSGEDY